MDFNLKTVSKVGESTFLTQIDIKDYQDNSSEFNFLIKKLFLSEEDSLSNQTFKQIERSKGKDDLSTA